MASPNEPDPPNKPDPPNEADAEFGADREKLLVDLKNVLKTKIPPTAWACLWLSDIDNLKDIIEKAQGEVAEGHFPTILSVFHDMEARVRIVSSWTQRKRMVSTPSTPQKRQSSEQETLPTRSKPQRNLCHQRDKKKCVLTKSGEPNEVTHIYPFSMRGENDSSAMQRPTFWDILRSFWSKERVDAWYNAIFSQGGTEVCQNFMCLAPHAHEYWTRAYFALKPISLSDDKRHLEMQFFWLPSNPYVREVDIKEVPSLSATKDQGPNLAKLWNHETDEMIRSGYKVSLETDDPESRPLPDLRLLEMQWMLHRVAAMRGSAEGQDDFHSNSNDDSEDDEALCDWETSAEYDEMAWQDDLITMANRF